MEKKHYGFLVKNEIKEAIRKGIFFDKGTYNLGCLTEIGYDMRLGEEVYITPEKKPQKIEEGGIIKIESGQFAALTTEEYLKIPTDVMAFVTMKFSIKGRGLVNISGFHVDPGFEGKFTFSVFNAGPSTIVLKRRVKIFTIFFYKLPVRVKAYTGEFGRLEGLPESILEPLLASQMPLLGEMNERVKKHEMWLKFYTPFMSILCAIVGVLIGVLVGFLLHC